MFRLTWKSLLGRKLRLVMSAFSIVLGVAFVVGSLVFTNLLSAGFDSLLKGSVADVNVMPEAAANPLAPPGETAVQILPDLVAEIGTVEGVSEATGLVSAPGFYPLDADGNLMAFGGAPGLLFNWFTTPAMDGEIGANLIEGRPPETNAEVLLDPATLTRSGLVVGDSLEVATTLKGTIEFTITGTAAWGGGTTAGASYLFVTLERAQELVLAGADRYTGVWVSAEAGADVEQLASTISDLVPDGVVVETGEQQVEVTQELLDVGLGFVNVFLLVFAAIALLVAGLLILNTFSILVMQRSRELALLRAVGASSSQVRRSVIAEALVVGVIGATLGIAAGYGLAWLILLGIDALGVDLGGTLPALTWQAVTAGYAVALVITALAAGVPARRASRTRPVEAMARAAGAGKQSLGAVAYVGVALVQLGIAAVVVGLAFNVAGTPWWVGLGCAAILVGTVLGIPIVAWPLVWLFGKIYALAFGAVGTMAGRNAARQPGRTGATAATLMIGLALVTTVAILAATTTNSLRADLTENQRGDFVVTPVNFRPFDASVVGQFEQVDGVEQVWSWASGGGAVDGQSLTVTGMTADTLANGTAIRVLGGTLNDAGNTVLMDYDTARDLGLSMGQNFELLDAAGEAETLLVAGMFDRSESLPVVGQVIVNTEVFPRFGDARLVESVVIRISEGADAAVVQEELRSVVDHIPTVSVSSNDEYADALVAQFDQVVAVIYALLALAIVISVLGIVNTLGLSVMERTREIGLLRAVGLTRPQLRSMVGLESVVVALLGSVLGTALGLAFGVVIVELLEDEGLGHLAIPWGQLGLFVALAAFFGVLAALGPARRAARLGVLDAIAED